MSLRPRLRPKMVLGTVRCLYLMYIVYRIRITEKMTKLICLLGEELFGNPNIPHVTSLYID